VEYSLHSGNVVLFGQKKHSCHQYKCMSESLNIAAASTKANIIREVHILVGGVVVYYLAFRVYSLRNRIE
jgi:hypothetical protein